MSVTGNPSKMVRHSRTVILAQIQNTPRSCDGSTADFHHTTQKKHQPIFPIPGVAHRLKVFVILGSMRFEEMRYIEDWSAKELPLAEEKSDQQSSNPTIAVKEGMDRLKLGMSQADSYKWGKVIVSVQKYLEIPQRVWHLLEGRRNKNRILHCASGWAYPVL